VSGTGFLYTYSNELCAVATAAHVIQNAYWWELPMRVIHASTGKTLLLHHGERAVFIDNAVDTAVVVFPKGQLAFPEEPLEIVEPGKFLRIGNPIGWLGFPAISESNLCFFLGTGSCWIESQYSYLVDGVAINGVSGGPAFWAVGKAPLLVGILSAYIPNRATGETLPGLCVVRDPKHLHEVVGKLKSIDDARNKEAAAKQAQSPPPSTPPPAAPEKSGGGGA
jgi:hypothetical protein